jgi:hypothetical protein
MDPYSVFPDKAIDNAGKISKHFLNVGIQQFVDACNYVYKLPYGYNSDRDDVTIIFKEKMGSCATKHAVISTLAAELDLPIYKRIGIYPMAETIVSGTDNILNKFDLPYIPMIHCFLEYGEHRVDLTEGNQNGKNQPVDTLFYTERVKPNISAKHEYRLYRQTLKERILPREN